MKAHLNSLVKHFRMLYNTITTVGKPVQSDNRRGENICLQMSLLRPSCKSTSGSITMFCQTLTIKRYSSICTILLHSSCSMNIVFRTSVAVTHASPLIEINVHRDTLMNFINPGMVDVVLRGNCFTVKVRTKVTIDVPPLTEAYCPTTVVGVVM